MNALLIATLLAASGSGGTLVERRLLVKEGHFLVSGGATWLERDDHYLAPGAQLSLGYFPSEDYGFELKGAFVYSWLDASASEIVQQTGLQPDARKPFGLLLGGYRRSLAYGKVLAADQILHFEFQGAVNAGVTFTDNGPAPTALLSPALLMRLTERLHLQLDLGIGGAVEQRRAVTFAPLLLPSLSLGVML